MVNEQGKGIIANKLQFLNFYIFPWKLVFYWKRLRYINGCFFF